MAGGVRHDARRADAGHAADGQGHLARGEQGPSFGQAPHSGTSPQLESREGHRPGALVPGRARETCRPGALPRGRALPTHGALDGDCQS